jgi:hypothetical protein
MIEPTTYAAPKQTLPNIAADELQLSAGGTPQTVYISITGSGTNLGAAFSATQGGQQYAEGMRWPVDAEYALFINFVFEASTAGTINEVQPKTAGLWVAQASSSPSNNINQQICVQDIPGTYDFRVKITPAAGGDPVYFDPKIVVTPL